jgi:hypothetical protein
MIYTALHLRTKSTKKRARRAQDEVPSATASIKKSRNQYRIQLIHITTVKQSISECYYKQDRRKHTKISWLIGS